MMDELEDAQLELESLKREVDAYIDLFGPDKTQLKPDLTTAERSIRKLLRQYEQEYKVRRNVDLTSDISLSEELISFMGTTRNAPSGVG
jgi:hypothetical protein